MKVRLIKKKTIAKYIAVNKYSKTSFDVWLDRIRYADWKNVNDISKTFVAADILGNSSNRIIFNVGGNKFRVICKYHFGETYVHLFVCWIGNHKEYDKLCMKNLQYSINLY